ncbi:MAG: TMEM198/TM7SF3 family protein [Candidatus Krumholzibacteriota bacterium]|nr:TMEM198/TM7SF3 family protein [Candidatus Krumholzibacteriota bacterium]
MLGLTEQGLAALAIVFGIVSCFWGYRIFKIVLGIFGFILGAYLAGTAGVHFTGGWGLIALSMGLVGGLIGGALVTVLYFAGVFLVGSLSGWVIGALLLGCVFPGLNLVFLVILALAGGILALVFQKMLLIISTSFLGSWYLISGAYFFMGSGYTPLIIFNYPFCVTVAGGEANYLMVLCWLALGLAGVIFQYRYSKKSAIEPRR